MKAVVELYRLRRRAGWMGLVWVGAELWQVVFGESEGDVWWGAQEWVAVHGEIRN